jgi:hypothetical protein
MRVARRVFNRVCAVGQTRFDLEEAHLDTGGKLRPRIAGAKLTKP